MPTFRLATITWSNNCPFRKGKGRIPVHPSLHSSLLPPKAEAEIQTHLIYERLSYCLYFGGAIFLSTNFLIEKGKEIWMTRLFGIWKVILSTVLCKERLLNFLGIKFHELTFPNLWFLLASVRSWQDAEGGAGRGGERRAQEFLGLRLHRHYNLKC